MWTSSGTNPPAGPTGLTATPTNNQVRLLWFSSVDATNYNVKRSTTSGGPYTNIATISATNYTDTSVATGPTYFYVVSALDQFGESNSIATPGKQATLWTPVTSCPPHRLRKPLPPEPRQTSP